MMFSWRRLAAARASRRKRWSSSSSESGLRRTLMATERSRSASRPRYTVPMPPFPRTRRMSYLPIRSGSLATKISCGERQYKGVDREGRLRVGPIVAPLADAGFGHLCRQGPQARNSAALAEVEVLAGRPALACAQVARLAVEGGVAQQAAEPGHVGSPLRRSTSARPLPHNVFGSG